MLKSHLARDSRREDAEDVTKIPTKRILSIFEENPRLYWVFPKILNEYLGKTLAFLHFSRKPQYFSKILTEHLRERPMNTRLFYEGAQDAECWESSESWAGDKGAAGQDRRPKILIEYLRRKPINTRLSYEGAQDAECWESSQSWAGRDRA